VKNITVSVPDEVYHAARVRAAEMGTSVSATVRAYLVKLASQPDKFEESRVRMNTLLEQVHREYASLDSSRELTREELHDRDALRRH
jgi:plasmid stability protein